MSGHIDLNNAAADPQTKRGRGRPRKNPPPPPSHPRPPDPNAPRVGGFAPGDMVWGKKLTHAAWPGLVYSAGGNGTGHEGQLLVSYFGDKAFAWCDAAELRPYEPYFPVAELYDDGGEDFDAALEASLDEFSRRVEDALATDHSMAQRPFLPTDFIALLRDLAADRMGFTNRVQAAVAKAHVRAFDKFRALPDPPQYTLELGLLNDAPDIMPKPKARDASFNCNSASTPSRRGRKRKEEVIKDDSDEDWDPRKKGGTDSDSDVDFDRRMGSRGRGSGALRGRPRGRPRKTDARMDAQLKDEEMDEKMEYPSAAQMLLQLSSLAADPVYGNYDSVPVIVSFFSKYKDSEAPSVYEDKELLEIFGTKKGRKKSIGTLCTATKAEAYDDNEQLVTADGQRGRRKSAGSLYSARKAEDSYWCNIIISDFDDGDSDYEGHKRKRASQNRSGNKKMKQEEPPQGGASTDPPSDEKPADGPAALILHFSSPEAIPSVDDINSIFRIHGPIMECETEITKKSKIAKVVFSKRADAERAFNSSGRYNAFGPSLLNYEIKYLPSAP
ncbi:PWWP domain-containing protein 5-like [Phragmites australis]|uniref:PWWP domain-containing protein 5-like n=1 Tax=Phragmites australis TaxID=29695 RepID=UPI002D773A07|nr:PWWP domain-containing protein 5-like [Phragmites australis]